MCPLRVWISTEWSGTVVFSLCSWSWCGPPGFAAFLGLMLKYSWGLDVISREESSGEFTLGVRFFLSQFCTLPGLLPSWPFASGCKSLCHSVQLSVSVSLFHFTRNFCSFTILSHLSFPQKLIWMGSFLGIKISIALVFTFYTFSKVSQTWWYPGSLNSLYTKAYLCVLGWFPQPSH